MLEDKHKSSTKLEDIGEFNLIDILTKDLKIKHKSTIKSIGDDAAVLDYKSKKIVVSTDFLIEGVHFDLSYMPLKHLGYKAVMVNVISLFPSLVAILELVALFDDIDTFDIKIDGPSISTDSIPVIPVSYIDTEPELLPLALSFIEPIANRVPKAFNDK